MAHSIQLYQGRSRAFNDFDLIAIMLVGLSDSTGGVLIPARAEVLDCWRAVLRHYGPGVIDLRLDEHASDEAAKNEMIALLASLKCAVKNDQVVDDLLNGAVANPGVVFRDYKWGVAQRTIDALIELLAR